RQRLVVHRRHGVGEIGDGELRRIVPVLARLRAMFRLRTVLIVCAVCAAACTRAYNSQVGVTGVEPTLAWQSGLVPISDQTWDRVTGNGWSYLRRTSSKDDDTQTDTSAPFSPQHVLRIVFTPDMIR